MGTLIEISEESSRRREEAAQLLRDLADSLERHNEVEFTKGGIRHRVKVADQVTFEIEIEVEDDHAEIEIEIRW